MICIGWMYNSRYSACLFLSAVRVPLPDRGDAQADIPPYTSLSEGTRRALHACLHSFTPLFCLFAYNLLHFLWKSGCALCISVHCMRVCPSACSRLAELATALGDCKQNVPTYNGAWRENSTNHMLTNSESVCKREPLAHRVCKRS